MELRLKQLRKYYGRTTAASLSAFSARSGERVFVSGPNGAGKSTLLRMIAGICRPDEGDVVLDGADLYRSPERVRRATLRNIGMLFSETFLYDELSVEENLRFFAALRRDAREPSALLAEFGLSSTMSKRVRDLSSGMRRKVALIRTFLGSPALVLLDEPFVHLDDSGSSWVEKQVGETCSRGGIVIVSGHAARDGWTNLAVPEVK
ncbi:MAG: ABC transporter ATP-binding protein [Deltaproteobacteria bacterium]|nr:ABC transporter ATP-binding protein [Deltaproteobacteria bacterium]